MSEILTWLCSSRHIRNSLAYKCRSNGRAYNVLMARGKISITKAVETISNLTGDKAIVGRVESLLAEQRAILDELECNGADLDAVVRQLRRSEAGLYRAVATTAGEVKGLMAEMRLLHADEAQQEIEEARHSQERMNQSFRDLYRALSPYAPDLRAPDPAEERESVKQWCWAVAATRHQIYALDYSTLRSTLRSFRSSVRRYRLKRLLQAIKRHSAKIGVGLGLGTLLLGLITNPLPLWTWGVVAMVLTWMLQEFVLTPWIYRLSTESRRRDLRAAASDLFLERVRYECHHAIIRRHLLPSAIESARSSEVTAA